MVQQIPIVAQFVSDYSSFVTNASRVEGNYSELQLVHTSLSKQVNELRDELNKKAKSWDSLLKEKEELAQSNVGLEERLQELRAEVDKFKKKESGAGASKDQEYESNRGLKLGKAMYFYMDKY